MSQAADPAVVNSTAEHIVSQAAAISSAATSHVAEAAVQSSNAFSQYKELLLSKFNYSAVIEPLVKHTFANVNDSFKKYSTLAWLWDILPFPPVLFTYSMIILSATFVVSVACKAAANKNREMPACLILCQSITILWTLLSATNMIWKKR